MGRCYIEYLDSKFVYVCKSCKIHLSCRNNLVSKDFWAGDGKAFLYHTVVNIYAGPQENRSLRTGLHSVCDVFCMNCDAKLG